MITAFIFFLHLIFSLFIFTKKWQSENLTTGLLNVGLLGILFAVGWSITGIISGVILEQEGFGLFFDRDTFSLTLLTFAEFFFYRMYYGEELNADGKGKQ